MLRRGERLTSGEAGGALWTGVLGWQKKKVYIQLAPLRLAQMTKPCHVA